MLIGRVSPAPHPPTEPPCPTVPPRPCHAACLLPQPNPASCPSRRPTLQITQPLVLPAGLCLSHPFCLCKCCSSCRECTPQHTHTPVLIPGFAHVTSFGSLPCTPSVAASARLLARSTARSLCQPLPGPHPTVLLGMVPPRGSCAWLGSAPPGGQAQGLAHRRTQGRAPLGGTQVMGKACLAAHRPAAGHPAQLFLPLPLQSRGWPGRFSN